MRSEDNEYRQRNHRPSYQHENPVEEHRDIMTRICAFEYEVLQGTALAGASIFAVLLIVALLIIWQVWSRLGITGESTLNRTLVFWSWAFGARVLAYGQL
jgi:hypothetical protein